MRLSRRYRFSAAHRLYTAALKPEENRELYGKCANPFGHGHDYVLDVTVEGPVDGHGQVVNREELDELVQGRVLARVDHRDLNTEVPEFAELVPTTESLASVIQRWLSQQWPLPARLVRVQIAETARNRFAWEATRA